MNRNQCEYGFWCETCKSGFVGLTWENKEKIKSEHQHSEALQ